MDKLGERIRFLRKIYHISQIALAKKIKLETAVAISKYESNQRTPDMSRLLMLADNYNVGIRWILRGEVSKTIGSKLEQARRNPKNRMKAEDVAQKLGVTREFIFAIEEGKIEPSDSFLSKLCVLYGINEFEVRDENIRHVPAHSTTGDSWLDNAITKHRELIDLVEKNPEIEPEIVKLLKGIEAGKNLQKRLGPGESYE